MDKFHQELFDVLHDVGMSTKENQHAASLAASGINKAQLIHDFINGKH
jgi:hypothetical protein